MKRIQNKKESARYADINAALEKIARRYDLRAALALCPYISEKIGIAEWIVRYDMVKRYRRKARETTRQNVSAPPRL